jgi:hypothetical protein
MQARLHPNPAANAHRHWGDRSILDIPVGHFSSQDVR